MIENKIKIFFNINLNKIVFFTIQPFWVADDNLDSVPPESTQIHGSSLDYKCRQDNLGISSVSPSHSKLSISGLIQAPFG